MVHSGRGLGLDFELFDGGGVARRFGAKGLYRDRPVEKYVGSGPNLGGVPRVRKRVNDIPATEHHARYE